MERLGEVGKAEEFGPPSPDKSQTKRLFAENYYYYYIY